MSTLSTQNTYKINNIVTDEVVFTKVTQPIADFPKSLWYMGTLPSQRQPAVAIVGSRKITTYGREVTYRLSFELASQGLIILSGLALGADAVAHQAALDAGGLTIAVLPTPLNRIHPAVNRRLADHILDSGGALLSEYGPEDPIYKGNFVARNRIVSGLSDGVLITEAAERSGTLSTANFALDQGKPVMVVPGNITSPLSAGCNGLLKVGATPVTTLQDVLFALGLENPRSKKVPPRGATPQETVLLQLIHAGIRDGEALQQQSGFSPAAFSQTLTMLEITGKVRALGANQWGI